MANTKPTAAQVTFTQLGTGAGVRDIKTELSERVAVTQFAGVDPTGSTDSTIGIQNAITYIGSTGGGELFFPRGNYNISAALTCPHQNVIFVGGSRFGTILQQTNASANILEIAGNFCGVRGLSFLYTSTPMANATAIKVTKAYATLDTFAIRSAGIGVHFVGGDAVFGTATNFMVLDYETCGILIESLNDVFVSKFLLNAGTESRGTLGGIRLLNKVEAFVCTDGDILLGQYSLTMAATSNILNVRPAYNNFTNVFFDSAFNSSIISKCVETDFVGCWFSGGRFGAGVPGAIVDQCRSVRFTNTRFFNNGGSGVVVTPSASDITFENCKAESNSVTSGAGITHGFQFTNGCNDFKIIGCTAGNGLYTGVQGYGIFIGTGCDNFVIRDNNVRTNLTGGIQDGSSATANKTVHGNIGYRTSNTGAATILATTSSVVVSHNLAVTPRQQEIMLTRGSGNAGSTDLYVADITATQFTINTAAAPISDMIVNWVARCAGA